MLNGYHNIFNTHALKEISRTADIPEPSLGIGYAERLDFQKLHIYYEPVVQTPVFEKIKTLEESSYKGQGNQVSMDAFPMTGYMGEQLGGF